MTAPRLVDVVFAAAAAEFGVEVSDITGVRQQRHIIVARQAVCWVLYRRGLSYSVIGRHLHRDHSTIMHAVARIQDGHAGPELCARAERLLKELDTPTPLVKVAGHEPVTYASIDDLLSSTAVALNAMCMPGRELDNALDRLAETRMWAVAAVDARVTEHAAALTA